MYLKMVKGEEDKVYQRLYSLYCSLIDNVGVVSSKGVKYYETMTVSSFEKKNKVNVVVKRTEPFTELVEDPKDSDKQIQRMYQMILPVMMQEAGVKDNRARFF